MLKDTATGSIKLLTKVYQYLPWINRLIDERITDLPVSIFNISDSARLFLKVTTTKRPATTTKMPTTTTKMTTTKRPEEIKSTSIFCSGQYTLVSCSGSAKIEITKAIFAVDLDRHCGDQSQTDMPIGETIYFSDQNYPEYRGLSTMKERFGRREFLFKIPI